MFHFQSPERKILKQAQQQAHEKGKVLIIALVLAFGGTTPIHELYGDVPPVRVWFFDRPLMDRVSNSKISEDFL